MKKLMICAAATAILAGCASNPRAYETSPVEVETPQGIVTCQLYSPEILVWDRSIDRPRSMGVQEADEICLEEGRRQWERARS